MNHESDFRSDFRSEHGYLRQSKLSISHPVGSESEEEKSNNDGG